MTFIRRVIQHEGYWQVPCPATGFMNLPRNSHWTFDGNFENPTFNPSLVETYTEQDLETDETKTHKNHVWIRNGSIEYLSDSTHKYAGQTVPIPPISDAELILYYNPDGTPTKP